MLSIRLWFGVIMCMFGVWLGIMLRWYSWLLCSVGVVIMWYSCGCEVVDCVVYVLLWCCSGRCWLLWNWSVVFVGGVEKCNVYCSWLFWVIFVFSMVCMCMG